MHVDTSIVSHHKIVRCAGRCNSNPEVLRRPRLQSQPKLRRGRSLACSDTTRSKNSEDKQGENLEETSHDAVIWQLFLDAIELRERADQQAVAGDGGGGHAHFFEGVFV